MMEKNHILGKPYIEKTCLLAKNIDDMQSELKHRFDVIKYRIEEMREKYEAALRPFRDDSDEFYGYPAIGYREITGILPHENYYQVQVLNYFRGSEWLETIDIPYDSCHDKEFVEKFIAEKKRSAKKLKLIEKEKNEYRRLREKYGDID